MVVSPSGHYLVTTVVENMNIWQMGTEALLGVVSRHYEPVTGDSSHLVSGGAEEQVLVSLLSPPRDVLCDVTGDGLGSSH